MYDFVTIKSNFVKVMKHVILDIQNLVGIAKLLYATI